MPGDGPNADTLAAAGIHGPAWYLIRPDGHVAIAGATFEAAALEAWLAAPTIRLVRRAPAQADGASAAAAGSRRAFTARDTAGARPGAIGASSRRTPPSIAASGAPSR